MPAMPHPLTISPLPPFKPDLYERAWVSQPHPRLPLLATAHSKAVTVFSLADFSTHSTLTGGHSRSVRSVAWKPGLPSDSLCLVTGSFDSTAGLWRWGDEGGNIHERDVNNTETDWEFTLVLEGHDSEIKGVAFSPAGQYLATCSRDKSIWIWEDVGATEADDEWETVAVLSEHEADVKAVAWCPETNRAERKGAYSSDCLASTSYDDTIRIWREDGDGEWVCVSVLEGHGGTVWGVQWEPCPKDGLYPRLLTFSADATIRVWSLREDLGEGDDAGTRPHFRSGLGGMPNTMRTSTKEEWICSAIFPKLHYRDIYATSWSSSTGLVASAGSDGMIAVYQEESISDKSDHGDTRMLLEENGTVQAKTWKVVGQVSNAHGPYEINHIVWSKRFDSGTTRKGEEEILVTTGDDGVIRPWQLS